MLHFKLVEKIVVNGEMVALIIDAVVPVQAKGIESL